MELTKNDGKFIYRYKGIAHVNPSVIHQRRSYIPCELAIMVTHMAETLEKRQKICDRGFNLNSERPPLNNKWDKYLALNHTTSLQVAKQSCSTLGLPLPEVRLQSDIKELKSFMAQEGVAQVFAGISFDYHQHRPGEF